MRDQKATNAQTGEALNPAVTQQSRHSGEEKAGLAANAANAGRHERDVEMDNMSSNTRTPPNMHQGTDKHDGAGHTQPGPDSNEELDRHAFDNPAAYEHQRTVWLASDELGIAKQEMSKLRAAGVDVSDAGATMDSKVSFIILMLRDVTNPFLGQSQCEPQSSRRRLGGRRRGLDNHDIVVVPRYNL